MMSSKKVITLLLVPMVLLAVAGGAYYFTAKGRGGALNVSATPTPEKVFTKDKAIAFTEGLLTNQKYGRHNLIWKQIDEESQRVYGDAQAYEKFFSAYARATQGKGMKDFSIDRENVVLRNQWTSPQGVTYNSVYDIPVELTLNDGTADQETYYVFEVNGKLKTTSGITSKQYEDVKQQLVQQGYLDE